jgi:thiaminase/transcriptional activator TenA
MQRLLPQLAIPPELDTIPVPPTSTAYPSYLAIAYPGSFTNGLAAVLPCCWICKRWHGTGWAL